MAGLKRNSTELREAVSFFTDIPFALLAPETQKNVQQNLNIIFSNVFLRLEKENLQDTVFGGSVKALLESVQGIFNEKKFATHLRAFSSVANLDNIVEKFLNRVEPFYLSETQAQKYRDSHSKEEILGHDTEIISKALQLYALDYFLLAYKSFLNSQDKKSLVLRGIDKAPALAADALDDDMLKKVVYSLCGSEIRARMINDYYKYKTVFLPVCDEDTLTDQKIIETQEALRKYCISLLDISVEHGITVFKNSLLLPYGANADLLEIKKQISNV